MKTSISIPGISIYDIDIGASGLLTVSVSAVHGTVSMYMPTGSSETASADISA